MRTHAHYHDESPADLAIFFASRGYPDRAASLIAPGFLAPASEMHLCAEERADLETELLLRGMALVDEEGDVFAVRVEEIVGCIWCRQDHGVDDDHAACAGPIPLDEVDGEETGRMCSICFKAILGPPFPFCCSGRARLIKKIEGPGPFRACSKCHGKGCETCEGTGVAL